eukprot:gene2037-biopygen2001
MDTDPESARNTHSRPWGETSTRVLQRSIAGWCVSPPNMTCDMLFSCVSIAALIPGTLYPWIADHHDAMPSVRTRPSSRVISQPAHDATFQTFPGFASEVYGCHTCRLSKARSSTNNRTTRLNAARTVLSAYHSSNGSGASGIAGSTMTTVRCC